MILRHEDNSSKQDANDISHAAKTQDEMSTKQSAKTKPGTNAARSPPRPTRRHGRGSIGKSTTGKQAGNGTRHAIIVAARSSTDPEGGGPI